MGSGYDLDASDDDALELEHTPDPSEDKASAKRSTSARERLCTRSY